MDYGKIISRSWRITWENKYLWVLGFLVALTRINSNFNYNVSNSDVASASVEQMAQATSLLLTFCCVGLFIGLALWLLSLVAKGGMITAVVRIENGEKSSLGDAFRAGTERIGSLMGMNLVLYLPFILLGGVCMLGIVGLLAGSGITAASFAEKPGAVGDAIVASLGLFFFCFCGLTCGLILVGFLLQFINAFAFRGIMLRNLGAIESLSHGWQVFRGNLGEVLLLALLFFVISIVYSIGVGIVLFPLTLVLLAPMIALTGSGDMGMIEMLFLAGGTLCLGVIGAALASILATWQSAAFTLAYQEWTTKATKAVSSEL